MAQIPLDEIITVEGAAQPQVDLSGVAGIGGLMQREPGTLAGLDPLAGVDQGSEEYQELQGLIQTMTGSVTGIAAGVNSQFPPHMAWLNDQSAKRSAENLTRVDLAQGLTVEERIEKKKFEAVTTEIERQIQAVFKMREENQKAWFASVRAVLQAFPDHPALAELAKPNRDQTVFAIIMAALNPQAGAEIFSALAQSQLQQQAVQQRFNDIEFDTKVDKLDAELGLLADEAEFTDRALADEAGFLRQEDRDKGRDEQQAKRDKQLHKNRLEEIADQAESNLQVERARLIRAVASLIDSETLPPSALPAIMKSLGLDYSLEEISASESERRTAFDADVFETMSKALRNMSAAQLDDIKGRELEFFADARLAEIEADTAYKEARTVLTDAQVQSVLKQTALMDKEATTRRLNALANFQRATTAAKADPKDAALQSKVFQTWGSVNTALVKDKLDAEQVLAQLEAIGVLPDDEDEAERKRRIRSYTASLKEINRQIGASQGEVDTAFGIKDSAITSPDRGPRVGG